MRTIKEVIDDEIFIDAILDPRDMKDLHEKSIEPVQIEINETVINLWVRIATARELWEDEE